MVYSLKFEHTMWDQKKKNKKITDVALTAGDLKNNNGNLHIKMTKTAADSAQ